MRFLNLFLADLGILFMTFNCQFPFVHAHFCLLWSATVAELLVVNSSG